MAERGVIFDRASAGKVAEATRRVLGKAADLTGDRLPFRGGVGGGNVRFFTLVVSGGEAGGGAENCSFTYDVYALDTETLLGEDIAVQERDNVDGVTYESAVIGWGYMDGETPVLIGAKEKPFSVTCTEQELIDNFLGL